MPLILWGLMAVAGVGAGGYFLHETGTVVQDTTQAVQTTADSTVKVVLVGAGVLWALHHTGILKGSIKL